MPDKPPKQGEQPAPDADEQKKALRDIVSGVGPKKYEDFLKEAAERALDDMQGKDRGPSR